LSLHQRRRCCGWHTDRSYLCHQTSEGTGHSKLFSQSGDPSRSTLLLW